MVFCINCTANVCYDFIRIVNEVWPAEIRDPFNSHSHEKLYDCDMSHSMTTFLTHTVAHSNKPYFMPKTNNQPSKKFSSFALS